MIPFVAGVLSGMAAQKIIDGVAEQPVFEPVEMREVSEEHVKEVLNQAKKSIRVEEGLEQIPAREVSESELPDYIRDKLAARANVAD